MNPYPRPPYAPPGTLAKQQGKQVKKGVARKFEESRPIYIKSIDVDKGT